MAVDLRAIPPASLIRMLNSTRIGTVLTERQLYRHRMQAGMRIGDGNHIHLLRYAAWLAEQLQERSRSTMATKQTQQQQYEQHRRRAAKRQADIAEAGQEIGPPPAVVNSERRTACERDFRAFCETYCAPVFYLSWSDDHHRAIAKIERAVLDGQLFAFAMPRGSGKTSLCLVAVLWAVLYGHCKYVCLIAATEKRARKLLEKVYNALERNALLFEDFPEVCWPIRKLERTPQRAPKQRCNGRYTSMLWTKNEIVLPTVDGSVASGTIVTVCGLTGGEVRGQVKDMPDGGMLRPSLVLLDDPQTKASAKSPTQTHDRVELLQGDVMGMAGPDRNIAGMMPCTVIRPGDMADEILSPERHPEWHGERTKLIYAWPQNEALWEEYASVRAQGLRRGDPAEATEFYRQNRAAMDAGARVAWPERFPPDCISALQHAMNLKLRDEAAFFAEYQNEPMVEQDEEDLLTAEQIAGKLNRRMEATVPSACTKLAMYIDVHKKLLYWAVLAFEPNFTAYLVAYGMYPDQKRQYCTMREARRTLLMAHRGHGEEAAIYAGLEALSAETLGRTWRRDDGAELRVSLCLIDSGYQKNTVDLFARQTKFAGLVLPAKGLPVTASSIPLEDRNRKKGEELGDAWRITGAQGEYSVRLVLIDTNHWKSFLQARLVVPIGGPGCLSLWGKSETRHRLLSEHLAAEYRVRTEGRGRKIDEWKLPAHKPDNHYLDCCVGAMAAGSILGCRLLGAVVPKRPGRPARRRKAKYF